MAIRNARWGCTKVLEERGAYWMNNAPEADFTIFAHVYYPDTWEEMVNDLDALVRQPFDLIITRPIGSRPAARPQSSHLRFATELEVENRGRDILPFLTALKQQIVPPFDIGLKIHTKRSPHRRDGDDWRQFLVGSLLKTEGDGLLSGHKLLGSDPRIGLVAAQAHLLPLGGRVSINEKAMMKTLRRMELTHTSNKMEDSSGIRALSLLDGHRFPAGAMFWFRRAAMRKVREIDFTDLFVRENGQLDGTAAHAFERLFALIAEQEGFIAAGMENAEPILNHRGALSRLELVQMIDGGLAQNNPFSLPLADFWRRHPSLLKWAHRIYVSLPQGSVRLLRRSVGRGW
jgi:lipopolysaccharide biosynthesis protein